jgi:hypothetical protein
MTCDTAPDFGLKVRGTRNRVGGSYFGFPSASNLANRTWKAGGSSFQLILVFLAAAIGKLDDGGDKITVSVTASRYCRVYVDRDDGLLFCPQFKLLDLGFRMPRQNFGAIAMTKEAQHGKSPNSGADRNNLKPKLD